MRAGPAVVGVALVLLGSGRAAAEAKPPSRWAVEARASYVVLGTARHTTGGVMSAIAGRFALRLAPELAAWVGAQAGAFGFGGSSSRWIGVLAGPSAGASFAPTALPFELSAAILADVGRIPVCNAWGLCLRFVGVFPAAQVGAVVNVGGHAQVGGALAVRYVKTLAWEGASWEPAVLGRVRF